MKTKIIIIALILSAVCFTKSKDTFTLQDTYDWKFTELELRTLNSLERVLNLYKVDYDLKNELKESIILMVKSAYLDSLEDCQYNKERRFKLK